MNDDGDILNAVQLGKRLHVSCKTVTAWANAGKIPAEIREGRLYRFDLAKVKAALAARAAQGTAENFSH